MKPNLNTLPRIEPVDLENAARSALSSLIERGFEIVHTSEEIITLKRGDIDVEAYFERTTREVGIGIRCNGVSYSLSEILRIADPKLSAKFRDPHATTLEEVASAWKNAGRLLLTHGSAILAGDESACESLVQAKKSWAHDYSIQVLADQVRPKAEQAFRQHDYQTVIELYESIRSRLRPSEVKRLAIALKHAAD